MSFSRLRRRASIVAVGTMLAALILIGFYSHAVQKGVLPSPVQPFVAHASPPVLKQTPSPVAVSARSAAPSPPPQDLIESKPTPPAQPLGPSPAVASVQKESDQKSAAPKSNSPSASDQAVAVHPARRPAIEPTSSPEAVPKTVPIRVDQATEALAKHWATSTNARPIVRIHYDAADVMRLLKLRRGLLVARGNSDSTARELYLQDPDAAAPLLAPYTPSLAAQFSSYALELSSAPEWARLTQTLPLYFREPNVELAFVPDHALATQIFRAVATASRSLFPGASIPAGTTFEGDLRLAEDQPQFELLDVRRGDQHLLTKSG